MTEITPEPTDPAGVSELADEFAGSVVFDERANVSEIGSWVRARKDRILAALRSPSPVLEVAKEALEPFAKIAGPIHEGETWTYLDAISGPNGTDELKLSTYVGDGTRFEILDAEDFRRALAALQTINERGDSV